jgi:hypothetical protein
MASLNTDTQTYLDQLRASIDARMARASALAATAARRDEARAALDAAEADYAREYRAATTAGWTERELRDAGLNAPGASPARRAGGTRTRRTTGATEVPSPAPHGADDQVPASIAS